MLREQIISPGDIADVLPPPQAPVLIDRGFLINDCEEELAAMGIWIPVTRSGLAQSPIEIATGIPLPIVAARDTRKPPNRHHAYFQEYAYKSGTVARQVVRLSRLQKVDVQAHATYHNSFIGTRPPKGKAREYAAVVLNCAGYVTRCGVKIDGPNVSIGVLTPQERSRLRQPGVFTTQKCYEEQSDIHRYLLSHAFSQKLRDNVEEITVEEFLSISQEAMLENDILRQRKLRLGIKLADRAIELAVDPIRSDFDRARDGHYLRRRGPATPCRVVKDQLKHKGGHYFPVMEDQLRRQFGEAA